MNNSGATAFVKSELTVNNGDRIQWYVSLSDQILQGAINTDSPETLQLYPYAFSDKALQRPDPSSHFQLPGC